jgi:photosystem II CP47 chlorophyll apoprotein
VPLAAAEEAGADTDSPGALLCSCAGCAGGCWHAGARPGPALAALLRAGSAEGALGSALAPVLLAALLVSATAWYGAAAAPGELFGPARFAWDASLFLQELLARAAAAPWRASADQLLLGDCAGSNPAKGGLFRSGPGLRGDGTAQSWLGRLEFPDPAGSTLLARRTPAFFETFPVVLVDEAGEVRAALSNRRAAARFSIESRGAPAALEGGVLGRQRLRAAPLVKALARRAQLGEVFRFAGARGADGVFRTSVRGWFTLAHSLLSFAPLSGHAWHGARALFRGAWLGVLRSTSGAAEYGKLERL